MILREMPSVSDIRDADAVRRFTLLPGSLAWRSFLINAGVVVASCAALIVSPATVSDPIVPSELAILAAGVVVCLAVNLVLVRRTFAPLERLRTMMGTVDLLWPGGRVEVDRAANDIHDLADAFNEMLDRLEEERRISSRTALMAQESERLRVGRELHDELGQAMTGVLLQLDQAVATHPGDGQLREARETARESLDRIRHIARGLRPDVLDDLGLGAALTALCLRAGRHGGYEVRRRLALDPSPLPRDVQVVVYRVAQESLTNVARHARAANVLVDLRRDDGDLVLVVEDDGVGRPPGAREGTGIRGMRERALLVHGTLSVGAGTEGGTRVVLRVPLASQAT